MPTELSPEINRCIFQIHILLSSKQIEHSREVYNLLDLLGDLGGVLNALSSALGIIVFPISYHSFVMKGLEKLFLARSLDSSIFVKTDVLNKKNKRKF
jgi:hypothetical protein